MSLLVPVAVAFTVFTLALVRVAYVAGRPAAPQPEREDPALIAAYERALGMPANPAEPWPLWKPEDGVRELAPLYPPSAGFPPGRYAVGERGPERTPEPRVDWQREYARRSMTEGLFASMTPTKPHDQDADWPGPTR